MLTSKDIDRMMQVFPSKEDGRKIVKEELKPLEKSLHDLVLGKE